MSNIFQRVKEINMIAGKVATADRQLLLEQCRIIQSELTETMEALVTGDWPEFRDGVSDVEFTSLGLFALSPFKYDQDMTVVCDSNMEKFDLSEADALLTRDKYAKLGIETYYIVSNILDEETGRSKKLYVTRSSSDQTDAKGKDYPADKWLKSYKWKEPVFTPLDLIVRGSIMQEFNQQFALSLEDSTYYEYDSQVKINKMVSKEGGKRVLDLINLGLAADNKDQFPILMSVQNPTGWKLENLLRKVYDELEFKNKTLKGTLDATQVTDEVSSMKLAVMRVAYDNNIHILKLLTEAAYKQEATMAAFDQLGQDQGPTGKPRV